MIHYTLRRQMRFRNNCNLKRNKREGRYKKLLRLALFVTRQALPMYSHKKSLCMYSSPWLLFSNKGYSTHKARRGYKELE
jgi:hypothetical protein